MKKVITICAILTVLALGTSQAMIELPPTISFDENGNGNYSYDGEMTYPLIGQMFVGSPSGLGYYGLPWGPDDMTPGDVVIIEPVATNKEISDVLHFTTMGWHTDLGDVSYATIFVFSELPENGEIPELADIGIPNGPYSTNMVELIEEGTENGWNGLHYTPLQGQPGYISGQNATYVFTSDVPEPATICMLGLGALSLLRKRK